MATLANVPIQAARPNSHSNGATKGNVEAPVSVTQTRGQARGHSNRTSNGNVKAPSGLVASNSKPPKGAINKMRSQGREQRMGERKNKEPRSELGQLIDVCRTGDLDKLSSLLSSGKDDILNKKSKEGTTPLHEACCYGNLECVRRLLKAGACATMWDVRGFSPLHCAVYNNHHQTLKVLLDFNPPSAFHWSKCEPNSSSEHGESPLHIACLRGHLDMSQFLFGRGADLAATDKCENTVFHYAASSNNGALMKWLIDQLDLSEVETVLDSRNKFGRTPAHRAATLGCAMSTSVLSHYHAKFSIKDAAGYTPIDLARLLGNRLCYEISCGDREPLSLPATPPSSRASISKSLDNLSSSQNLSSSRHLLPQRSMSNASSSTPPLLKRQPSITGVHRPRNLSIIRRSSMKRGSITSGNSLDEPSMYISRNAALQVRSSFKHKKTKSWDSAQQVLYDNTAYEPPPDILFVPPIERATLTQENSRFFSQHHDIKIRIAPEYWPPKTLPASQLESNQITTSDSRPSPPSESNQITASDSKPSPPSDPKPGLEVCVSAAMHLNQPFPFGYTIVSPIFFVSCKSARPCEVVLTLPHAVSLKKEEDKNRLCILSTTTVNPNLKADSPLLSPSDRSLTRLQAFNLEPESSQRVKFRTRLVHPSLFAVAVNERDYPSEALLPLRCSLYVSYPILEASASVSGLYVTTYVGMNLKTVDRAVANQTTKNNNTFEEKHFLLSDGQLRVEGGLTNDPKEWVMTSRDNGEHPSIQFTYTQLALTQDTDKDTYSHLPAYPPHTQYFIEPKGVAAAVKCRVRVLNSEGKEMTFIRVVPFSPSRELTPPPSQHRKASQPNVLTHHLPRSNGLGTTV